ncbi:hypothetical protein GBA52_011259 [Prunus armeniaca]|nr:hypothetical protein GBA52_011259 [Prunus armeniaca]
MALNPFSRPTKLMSFSSILLLLAMLMPLAKPQSPRETTIVLYLQDLASGPDATVVPITGIQGKPQSFTSFGTIFAVDDVITETPDKVSAQIGRAQGILVASSLSGSNVHVSMSLAFTNVEYNGSSLEIQGISRQFERYKEVSVVSGTGSFRYARGYATLETVFYDNKTSYSIIRCTLPSTNGIRLHTKSQCSIHNVVNGSSRDYIFGPSQSLDIFAGPNATDIPFAGISGKAWTFTQFATLYAIDDPVTEGSHPNSASVGRVQGTSMTSALDGLNAHVLFSIVFTNKKYNGSTLQIQGIDKQFEPVRELSVVSGTGKFRFVRGYITFETISVDIPNSYAVIRCNVTVKHY